MENKIKHKSILFLALSLAIVLISLGFTSACYCGDHHIDAGEQCDDGNTANGDGCSSTCKIESACNLQLTTAVSDSTAKPNEIVTYTLKYKNIGGSVCTGGGVKVQDTLDEGLEYMGRFTKHITNDLDHQGLDFSWGTIPGFNPLTNTLTWNAHTVSPGEEGTIKFDVKVIESDECGGDDKDYQIPNYFKVWSNEENWKNSNIVNVLIDNDCQDETNPVVDITNPISTTYSSQRTSLTFNVQDDNLDSCTYRLNGATQVNILSLINGINIITGISSVTGTNTWSVNCIDDSGNTGSDSVTFTVTIPSTCGDGVCNIGSDETCSTCAIDCGICPPIEPVCGNGIKETGEQCDDGNIANGDGCSSLCKTENNCTTKDSIKLNHFVQFCDTNWMCSGWSECSNGVMTRECVDKNNCATEYNKPSEQSGCNNNVISKVLVEKESTNVFWIILGIIILVILLIILINMLR